MDHGTLIEVTQTPSFQVSNSIHDESAYTPLHSHPFACVHFTHAGVYQEQIEKRDFSVGKGKILYKPSEIDHSNQFRKTGATTCRIELHLPHAKDIWLPQEPLVFDNPMLRNLFRRIRRELCHGDDLSGMAIEGLASELVCELVREARRKEDVIPLQVALKAEEIIRDRFPNLPKISQLAEELGTHRSQLARIFKASHGVTITDFIRNLRIEKAIELLKFKHKTIAEIALECGFNDQSHFTRIFRRVTATTPTKWRQ